MKKPSPINSEVKVKNGNKNTQEAQSNKDQSYASKTAINSIKDIIIVKAYQINNINSGKKNSGDFG